MDWWWIKLINGCLVVSQIDVTSAADIKEIIHTNPSQKSVCARQILLRNELLSSSVTDG